MIKRNLACFDSDADKTCKAFGRDIVTVLPREREITSDFTNQALLAQMNMIIDMIRILLERTLP